MHQVSENPVQHHRSPSQKLSTMLQAEVPGEALPAVFGILKLQRYYSTLSSQQTTICNPLLP